MTAKSTSCRGWKADSRQTPEFPIATLNLQVGGRIGFCPLPGGCNRFETDLAAVLAWDPALVLSLTEKPEMEAAGSWGLGEALERNMVEWAHLPIRDYGGPGPEGEAVWLDLSAGLHNLLDDGKAVLLHCRGGQGRSGMIALRLMVKRGEDPSAALDRLRCERPGAVETGAQLTWAQRAGV